MANRKTRKKRRTIAKKVTPKKKAPKKLARKRPAAKRKSAKKKASPKKAAAKSRVRGKKKRTVRKTARARRQPGAVSRNVENRVASAREGLKLRSGGQSGDLQGLSSISGADSESVDELLEEGNAFEADVVKGVEEADNEGEVRTHEVPEDDVPEEYLDQD
jgi:hypothetical protein